MYIEDVMKTLLPLLFIPLLASSTPPPLKPVRWSLVEGSGPHTIAPGRAVEVTLQADIEKGWHIYSLTQKPGGPIPLRIQLVGAADVAVRGAIKAPRPVTKFDPNFGIETELHRGKPKFTLAVGVPAGSLAGKREVQVAARYQACSATLCLPPRTEKLGLTLRIASAR